MSTLKPMTMTSVLRAFLQHRGIDILDEHFKDTPKRWMSVIDAYTQEYDSGQDLLKARFKNTKTQSQALSLWNSGIVVQGPIPYRALCAHHLLPVTGHAYVAYIPDEWITGLSKLSRVVYGISHRKPSIQEKVGDAIAAAIQKHLESVGSACIISAEHGCMAARGIQEVGVKTTTAALTGVFRTDATARSELYELIKLSKGETL